jgi:hypothetical protein
MAARWVVSQWALWAGVGLATSLLGPLTGPCAGLENRPARAQVSEKESRHGETYLSLVVKLQDAGPPELLKATEVPGELIVRKEPSSNFVYEITKDGKTFLVGFLPEDPFLLRAFADPKNEQKENISRAKSATIILNVPDTDADAVASGRIGIKFYKVLKGSPAPETMSAPVLKEMLGDSKLALQFNLRAEALSAEMKRTLLTAPQ